MESNPTESTDLAKRSDPLLVQVDRMCCSWARKLTQCCLTAESLTRPTLGPREKPFHNQTRLQLLCIPTVFRQRLETDLRRGFLRPWPGRQIAKARDRSPHLC